MAKSTSLWNEARLTTLANAGLVLALLYSALPFVTYAFKVLAFPYQVDYGEGPILDQVVRLSHFENIYQIPTPNGPFTVANYPPLFHLVQVPFAWAVGPALWYGRAISWVAAATTAVLIGATVYTFTRDRLAAVTSGLIFVSIPYVAIWAPMNRVDCLALALTWTALFVIVRWPEARWSLVAAAALFTASAFTRQTSMLVGPLAACALLFKRGDRKRALLLGALTAAGCAVVGLALDLATRGGFFFHVVLANMNPLSLEPLASAAQNIVDFMALLVVCAAALFALEKAPHVRWFLLPYALGAVAVALTIVKVGSNVNYLLELCAALSACTGQFVATFRAREAVLRTVVIAALVLQALLFGVWWRRILALGLVAALPNPAAVERFRNVVARSDGPVLLEEDLALFPLSGKRIAFQPFEMTQLSRAGRWDQSAFVRSIEARQYAAIVMSEDLAPQRWTREMQVAIAGSYVPVEYTFGMIIYRPGPASTSVGTSGGEGPGSVSRRSVTSAAIAHGHRVEGWATAEQWKARAVGRATAERSKVIAVGRATAERSKVIAVGRRGRAPRARRATRGTPRPPCTDRGAVAFGVGCDRAAVGSVFGTRTRGSRVGLAALALADPRLLLSTAPRSPDPRLVPSTAPRSRSHHLDGTPL